MAHLHEVRDMDTHFVIDPITRVITNPNSAKNKLMQGDHNSEIYTFEIPKIVEGHDMSLCNQVRIHYNDIASDKANESKDVYLVNDLHIDLVESDTITFSWLISGNATKYAGLLSFRIQFLCIDESGAITYKWHTEVFKGITVSDGFDNSEAAVKEYTDVIAAWEVRLDALEEGGGGSGITVTAKPGQLIRVKEVDENGNPTAWEAAEDMPWTEGEVVHPIDPKYLPDGVPYVYKDYLLEETDAVGTTDPNYGKIWVIQNPPTVTAGETYTVIYNGVMYDCVGLYNSSFAEGAVALGNASVTGGANTGEPFAMVIVPNYAVICMDLSGATSVRIGIMGKVGHKIDDRCIPDTNRVLTVKFAEREDGSLVSLSHTLQQMKEAVMMGIPVVCIVQYYDSRGASTAIFGFSGGDSWIDGSNATRTIDYDGKVTKYIGEGWARSMYLSQYYLDGDESNKTIGNELWTKY